MTKRINNNVTADAAFLVFQAGYENGYGADGDHLKTLTDIDIALQAGIPMITLDLSDAMNAEAAAWSQEQINQFFDRLPSNEKKRLIDYYAE